MRSHVKAAEWRPWEGRGLEKIECHREDRDLEKWDLGYAWELAVLQGLM